MFEHGGKLRKTLIVNPETIRKTGSIHVPTEVVIKDLRDKTKTTMVINEVRIDVPLEDGLFDPTQLKKKKAPPIIAE